VNSRYVKKIIEHHLIGHCRPELALLVEGFHDVIPRQLLHECQINAIELELIVAGLPDDLDVADWRRHTNFQCNNHSAELEEWCWTAVAEMTAEDRAKLLSFTCGTSRLPFGGFAALEPPFQVDIGGNPSHLPLGRTCANLLELPPYDTPEVLMVNLHIATHSDAGFGFL
jgi:E3 ubiquitin-protein ligase NEDD4